MSTNASSSKLFAVGDYKKQLQTSVQVVKTPSSAEADFNHNLFIAESLFEQARKNSSIFDAEHVLSAQRKLRSICKKFITLNFVQATSCSIEIKLWKSGVYKTLVSYRAALLSAVKAKDFAQAKNINNKLSIYIQEAIGFYLSLIQTLYLLGAAYNTHDFLFFGIEAQLESISDAKQFKRNLILDDFLQKILINLGDLYRYHSIYCDTDLYSNTSSFDLKNVSPIKLSSWNAAFMIYQKVLAFNSNSGITYNQLAVLHAYRTRILESVYYYLRALTCASPFHSAKTNFNLQLNELLKEIAKSKFTLKIRKAPALIDPLSKDFDFDFFSTALQSEFINILYTLTFDENHASILALDVDFFFTMITTAVDSKIIDSRKLLVIISSLLSTVTLKIAENDDLPVLKKNMPSYAKILKNTPQLQSKVLEKFLNIAFITMNNLIDVSRINKLKNITINEFTSNIKPICFSSLLVAIIWLSSLVAFFTADNNKKYIFLKCFQKAGLRQTLRKVFLSLSNINTSDIQVEYKHVHSFSKKHCFNLSGWILPSGITFDSAVSNICKDFDSHSDLLSQMIFDSNALTFHAKGEYTDSATARSTTNGFIYNSGNSSKSLDETNLIVFYQALPRLAENIKDILDAVEVDYKTPNLDFEIHYESILDNFANFSSELKTNSEFFENNIDVSNCYQFSQKSDLVNPNGFRLGDFQSLNEKISKFRNMAGIFNVKNKPIITANDPLYKKLFSNSLSVSNGALEIELPVQDTPLKPFNHFGYKNLMNFGDDDDTDNEDSDDNEEIIFRTKHK
ncbi:hypothetical protein BB561_000367 [Smittium simulii]|uniref:DNA/RNA-binding domain-containing protein n=1 Tax=Smittium simulii TaxID=133385 RepID=A0A2T9YZE2_9FUNG|nr:hypothetical protein BB561_000367 [Smittium simulii]